MISKGTALAALVLLLVPVSLMHPAHAQGPRIKPRIVLMHDPELDDQNTLIRYLLYSDQFNTEGLVYASSSVHWAGDGKGTKWSTPRGEYNRMASKPCPCTSWRWKPGERFIDETVEAYARVYPNLKVHSRGYPAPDELRAKIYVGNIEFDGDISKDSPGSELVARLLLDEKPGPVYLLTGAGQSTIARALSSIQLKHESAPEWPAIRQKVTRKAIIQSWGDQDGTYASYIKPNWPDIEFRQMATATWGYGARGVVLPQYASYLAAGWMKPGVSDVGPFGALYRVWGDGKQMVPGDLVDYFGFSGVTAEELKAKGYMVWTPLQEEGSWISEGDTSIFMNLIDNGLRGHQDATYGGWGGRRGTDHDDKGATPRDYATARWFGPAQQDFAARMKWTVTPRFNGANHAPVVSVKGPVDRSAARGETVRLEGRASDPDGNAVTLKWWQYTDAGTYPGSVALRMRDPSSVSFEVPSSASPGQTIHLILEATDNGAPALTRYQRVIVTVQAR